MKSDPTLERPGHLFKRKVKIGAHLYTVFSDDVYLNNIGATFEPDMCTVFKALIKPTFNVLDVGANIGCTALLFGDLAAHVDSFEPSPTTFSILQKNIQSSGLSNITPHNFGLGSRNESLTLTFAPSNRSGAFVSDITQASDGHTIEKIEIKKGDDALLNHSVDFIKIDVEGYEKNVIEGLSTIIEHAQPIVCLELNHWCLNAFQRTSVPDFFDFLLKQFPILYAVHGNTYLDLHNPSERFHVMSRHIIHFEYLSLVGAFKPSQLVEFERTFILAPFTRRLPDRIKKVFSIFENRLRGVLQNL